MKKLKNSKYRNTGILFELLSRQITCDMLNNSECKAMPIVRKYFGKNTALKKELTLYNALLDEKFNSEIKADRFINAIVLARKKLNEGVLKRQKYNLIKEIKNNFVIEDFFKYKLHNYKLLSSVYKLFEYDEVDNPSESVRCRNTIVENILKKNVIEKTKINFNSRLTEDKDINLLAYKYLTDKFNKKYNSLSREQKELLREYINSMNNDISMKNYIDSIVPSIKKELIESLNKIKSKVLRIKLKEVIKVLDKFENLKKIKDNHLISLLEYYRLIEEIKKEEKDNDNS